ncbi:PREDICTED: uncharacterized protein LOC107356270 [Acropora digitifera]|uniref:uncharacterized protein LOC107356270 n=1 Tax=Acropora digitifera TaxID=70779 RepID=UPI00077A8133|nr:PREDICTED: uncharacterized protein LOC107356270 [Acropora digitifera]
MSEVTFKTLLFRIGNRLQEIDACNDGRVRRHVLFMCNGKITHRDDDSILSLLNKLTESGFLGVDSMQMLKDILRAEDEWDFLDEIVKFETTRGEYKKLLQKGISTLEKANDLERLTCIVWGRLDVPEEKRNGVRDVRSLIKVLEEMNFIGVDCLNVLRELAIELNDDELLTELKEFQNRRTKEEKSDRRKGQIAAVLAFPGAVFQKIGVLKVHCTLQNLQTGLPLAVGIGYLLRRYSSLEEFLEACKKKALTKALKVLGLSEGSVCFMVQGETSSALVELYERYSTGRLQKDLQEFLVTDDIRQLADTEVVVLVHIDEKEFREALVDLVNVGKEDTVSSKQKDGLSEQMDKLSNKVDMVSEKVDKFLLSLEGKAVEKEAKKDEKDMCPSCGKKTTQDEIKKHLKEGCPKKGQKESSLEKEITLSYSTEDTQHPMELKRYSSRSEEDMTAWAMESRSAERQKVKARTVEGPNLIKKIRLDQQ